MRTFYEPKSNKIILDIILRYNLPMTSLTISLNTVIIVIVIGTQKKGAFVGRTVRGPRMAIISITILFSSEIPPRLHTTKYWF